MGTDGTRQRGRRRVSATAGVLATAVVAAACTAAVYASAILRVTPTSEDWRTVSAVAFPEHARARLAAGVFEADLRVWQEALSERPEVASRAAVLLGGCVADDRVDPRLGDVAARALIDRLSSRTAAKGRYAVGVDVVAARALDRRAERAPGVARVLASLAVGMQPHPDLAVRVECAAVALAAGERGDVAPFLLSVLRAETPAQETSPRSWERITTLAWVKTRAAEALSEAADTELRFRPDGSWAHQVAEADRLERLLRGR